MSQDFHPLVQIEFQILLCRGTQKSTAPSASASMGDGLANGPTGREEEEVDVRVHLTDDAEVDVEMQIECLQRYIGP